VLVYSTVTAVTLISKLNTSVFITCKNNECPILNTTTLPCRGPTLRVWTVHICARLLVSSDSRHAWDWWGLINRILAVKVDSKIIRLSDYQAHTNKNQFSHRSVQSVTLRSLVSMNTLLSPLKDISKEQGAQCIGWLGTWYSNLKEVTYYCRHRVECKESQCVPPCPAQWNYYYWWTSSGTWPSYLMDLLNLWLLGIVGIEINVRSS